MIKECQMGSQIRWKTEQAQERLLRTSLTLRLWNNRSESSTKKPPTTSAASSMRRGKLSSSRPKFGWSGHRKKSWRNSYQKCSNQKIEELPPLRNSSLGFTNSSQNAIWNCREIFKFIIHFTLEISFILESIWHACSPWNNLPQKSWMLEKNILK